MSIRNESVQSCWNCMGIILLCVFLANVPVSANHTIAPDISPGETDHIGATGPVLAADALAITANKDSVVRGGSRFSVTITGTPLTFYYLWVKNTSAMTGEPRDQPPTIYVSETVFQDPTGGPFTIGSHPVLGGGGRTILDDIPPSTANISNTEYYAAIRTGSTGTARVEWKTPVAAKPGPCTIHVEGDTVSADTVVVITSGINTQYGPVTGFSAGPEKVILHPAINSMAGTSADKGLLTINRGATVFIGEEGLNVSTALISAQDMAGRNSTIIGWWASPADTLTHIPTTTVDIAGREHHFLVSQAEFDGYEGNWYLVDPSTGFACPGGGSPVLVLTVRVPQLDIRIWDVDTGTDISGKSTTIGENLTFRIDTNICLSLEGVSRPDITSATQGIITIKVRDENGATLNYLYRDNATIQSLTNLSVNTSSWFWGGGTTAGQNYWATDLLDRDHYYYYPQGTYAVSAESSLNNMKENYLSGSAAYTGRTVSEVRTVTLVSVRDPVPPGTSISVSPNDDIISPGTSVTVTIDRSCNAFPIEGELLLSTDMDKPEWNSTILLNGMENTRLVGDGRNLTILGFLLSYGSSDNVAIHVILHGQYPGSTGDVMLVKVQQLDAYGNPVPGTTVGEYRPQRIANSTSSSDSSGPGQTVASSPGAGPGETMSFSFSQSGGTVMIIQVEIIPGQQIGPLDLIAQPVSPGQTLQVPALAVAGYEQITPVGLNPSAIDHGTITFGVTGTWLTGNNAAREDIVLMRYHDRQWVALPTRFDHQAGDIFYFIADTPGFSYFAVAVKPTGSPGVNTSLTPVMTPRLPAIAPGTIPHTPALLKAPVQSLPEVSQTTVVPPVSHVRSPGILYSVVVCGVAACLMLVSGVIIVRRWWIRRQNPGMFFG